MEYGKGKNYSQMKGMSKLRDKLIKKADMTKAAAPAKKPIKQAKGSGLYNFTKAMGAKKVKSIAKPKSKKSSEANDPHTGYPMSVPEPRREKAHEESIMKNMGMDPKKKKERNYYKMYMKKSFDKARGKKY
jgi:hypothetical protein